LCEDYPPPDNASGTILVESETVPDSAGYHSERTFPARLSALGDTVAFARDFCDRTGLDRSAATRLRLVIEELFTNTVRHGHRGDSDASVRMALAMIDGYVTVEYEDSAPPYDPVSRMTALPQDQAAAVDGPPTEALGTYLLGKSVYGAQYAYEDGCNRLRLVMPR
jgi:anti-sigma regulatory factor (Ser/Thr protein kinase)